MTSYLNPVLLATVILFASCSSSDKRSQSIERGVASSNDVAIERVNKACEIGDSSLAQLVDQNVVADQAKYLSGGSGFQTFLMKDGRLVIVSGVNSRAKSQEKCKIDHLKLNEGKIESTFANGRRLFMTVANKAGSKRVYFLTAVKNQESPEPYQVHEMKYNRRSSFASAEGFKIVKVQVGKRNKNGIGVLKKDGELYAYKTFKPWEWGDNNENVFEMTKGLASKVVVSDKRQHLDVRQEPKEEEVEVPQTEEPKVDLPKVDIPKERPTVTYLPKPSRSCQVSERVSFFFGLISFTETVSVPCR